MFRTKKRIIIFITVASLAVVTAVTAILLFTSLNQTTQSKESVRTPEQAISALIAAPPASLTPYSHSDEVSNVTLNVQLEGMDYAVSIEASSEVLYTSSASTEKVGYETLLLESESLFESIGLGIDNSKSSENGGVLFSSDTMVCSLTTQEDTVTSALYACVLNESVRTVYNRIKSSLNTVRVENIFVPQQIVSVYEVTVQNGETEITRLSVTYKSEQGILTGYTYFVGSHANESQDYITSYTVETGQLGKGEVIPESSRGILQDEPWGSLSASLIGEDI